VSGKVTITIRKSRKKRSDRKKDIKPTIPLQLREVIYSLSYITNTPVKDVAERVCRYGLNSKKVIEYLSQFFRRDYMAGSILYVGDLDNPSLQGRKIEGGKGRITIRFRLHDSEAINRLAFALDVTPSKATYILLDASVRNSNFINKYLQTYVKDNLDENRMRELKKIMAFINKNNPYDEHISWGALIMYLFDELKHGSGAFVDKVSEWVDKNK